MCDGDIAGYNGVPWLKGERGDTFGDK